ncbi:U6 snRNA-associated Sm-like protein LSm11 isoform X2 [Megalopta genalis]|uniref:U6 snRNA-associated Sm-like protein LSm11 isoform X2 n=1 Tax=Megalopta genalis TaxID=115081 RepID=UPI003FD15A69
MADADGSSSDESLDITSDKFDPLKALYTPKLLLTNLTAPLYDNVSKFESVMSGMSGKSKVRMSASIAAAAAPSVVICRDPLLPFIFFPCRRKMWRLTSGKGKVRGNDFYPIKVYTRNASGIRGHVEAYVAAFDKHWNLALEDCFEVWTRKVKRKAPALGRPSATTAADESAPKVVVTKIEGKRETLERHVPQMLLRGEHVAIIVKTN